MFDLRNYRITDTNAVNMMSQVIARHSPDIIKKEMLQADLTLTDCYLDLQDLCRKSRTTI